VPPRKSETLTEAELRLMDVLWQKGSATVQQVLDALPEKPALAYNSVLTTIRVLENKGYLEHVKDGRAHIYKPLMEREEATRSEIRHLVGRFFKNSHELLVLNVLEDLSSETGSSENQVLEAKELKRLRQLLQSREETRERR
jgi:BlaI family transcriptional regulator, penicillinase repressor